MIFDLHIHSKYSFDSILEPKRIIEVAKKRGLNGVAITDHNTIKGALETEKINEDQDFFVIVGSEISTEVGDVIGLFLNEEIKSRNSMEVIEEIKNQEGIVVLPHPYASHKLNDELVNSVDLIETFNSRTTPELNEKAKKLAEKYNKPFIANSDAHFESEIGMGTTIFENCHIHKNIKDCLLNNKRKIAQKYSPPYFKSASQLIRTVKLKEYRKVPNQLFCFAYTAFKMTLRWKKYRKTNL